MTEAIEPPDRILSREETAKILGISIRSLDRMKDIPRVRLGARRVGHPLRGVNDWIKRHTITESA